MKRVLITWMAFLLLGCPGLWAQQPGKKVVLDGYFNHEFKKNEQGEMVRFHYTWQDTAESGYSKLGNVFTKHGAVLQILDEAPTAKRLAGAKVYIIVDPDNEKETAHPNYIDSVHMAAIRSWVKKGGCLLILANDSVNAELQHLNALTSTFGIRLNMDSKSKVLNGNYEMGAFLIPANDPVFATARKVYMRDVTSLTLSGKATPLLKHHIEGYTVAAATTYGRGKVIVIGDPWFYNEYLNGRLGNLWDNDKAADDLVRWMLAR